MPHPHPSSRYCGFVALVVKTEGLLPQRDGQWPWGVNALGFSSLGGVTVSLGRAGSSLGGGGSLGGGLGGGSGLGGSSLGEGSVVVR